MSRIARTLATGLKVLGVDPHACVGKIVTFEYVQSVNTRSNPHPGFKVKWGVNEVGWVPHGYTDAFKKDHDIFCRENGLQNLRGLVTGTYKQDNGFLGLTIETHHADDIEEAKHMWRDQQRKVPPPPPPLPPLALPEKNEVPNPIKTPKEEPTMSVKIPALSTVVTNNIHAASTAAKLEVGKVANQQLARIVAKRLPADKAALIANPLGHLLLANVAQFASTAFYPDNKTLANVSQAMVTDAYQGLLAEIDLPGIITELLADKQLAEVIQRAGAEGSPKGDE